MITILFFIFVILLYISEGYHDAAIENVQNRSDRKLIEAWHRRDTIFHFLMNIIICFGMFVVVPLMYESPILWKDAIVMGFGLLGFRQLFMATSLNLFRNRKMFYLGEVSWFDKTFGKVKWLVWMISFILVIFTVYYFLI